jgi:hypothetical protein
MRPAKFLLIVGTTLAAGLICYARENQKADANQVELAERKRARMKTAKECFEAHEAAYNAGTMTLDVLLTVCEKLRDSELAAANNNVEKLNALRANVERTKKIRDRIQALHQQAARGGEGDKTLYSELAYQDAEIAILSFIAALPDGK